VAGSATAGDHARWLNRLRFSGDLEAAFQQDFFQRARNTMRAGSALAVVLMIPAAWYNESIEFRAATVLNGALALVALMVFTALSHRGAARVWKPVTFIAAMAAALSVAVLTAVWTPDLPRTGSSAHAVTLILLSQVLVLVYAFVIGRFTFRWYVAFAVCDLAITAAATGLWFREGLIPLLLDSTYSLVAAAAMLGLLAYRQERAARGEFLANHLLEAERARAERLLLNVLPASVAARLKERPGGIADDFEEVGILFADIVDFTPLAASLPAADVVRLLNDVFTAFDALADRFGLEKIKTIGDAYMAAAGLPEPREDHAAALAEMALAMRETVAAFRRADNGLPLEIRVGINTGPVVAGVIGTRKFIYDLWGDTVNVASRLESHGRPGAIQCTEAAYRLLRERYAFDGPAPLVLKGRGEMSIYLLLACREGKTATRGTAATADPSLFSEGR
jgi:class 3 adenylate cyclase